MYAEIPADPATSAVRTVFTTQTAACQILKSRCRIESQSQKVQIPPFQSAYSLPEWKKREQEVRAFLKIGDSFKKIVITNDMTPGFYDDNGILTINSLDFLTDADSLEK